MCKQEESPLIFLFLGHLKDFCFWRYYLSRKIASVWIRGISRGHFLIRQEIVSVRRIFFFFRITLSNLLFFFIVSKNFFFIDESVCYFWSQGLVFFVHFFLLFSVTMYLLPLFARLFYFSMYHFFLRKSFLFDFVIFGHKKSFFLLIFTFRG